MAVYTEVSMSGQRRRGAVCPPLCLRQIHPPRIFGTKMKLIGGIERRFLCPAPHTIQRHSGLTLGSRLRQPVQNLIKTGCLVPGGQCRSVDHDHRQAQLSRRDQLRAGPCAARILADDPGYAMLHKKRHVVMHCERAAIDHDMVVGQRWWRLRGIDQTQEIVVLGLRGKRGQVHAPDGQQDTRACAIQRRDGCGNIGDKGPVITMFGDPGGTGIGQKRRSRGGSGLHGMGTHLRGKGVRGIDQMGDALIAEVTRQPLWPAKSPGADRNRLRPGALHTARITERRGQARIGQRLHQSRGLCRAAKNKDVMHG